MIKTSSTPTALAALLAFFAITPACGGGGGGGGGSSSAQSTEHSTAAVLPVVVVERWLAYLAEEATTGPGGTDLNANGSLVDTVACVVDMRERMTRVLEVQADDIAIVNSAADGAHLYTVTRESADMRDWNMDMDTDDTVLLHSDLTNVTPAMFVAVLDDSGPCRFLTVDDRLYFQGDESGLAAGETSLQYVDTAMPQAPVRVANADAANSLDPELMATDEGLVFLTLDEVEEGRDLNGDADMTDTEVLALVDGTDPAAMVFEVPLALGGDSGPVRALQRGANDWLVAFLVEEAAQGNTNLNDNMLFTPSWQPNQCLNEEDGDTLDEVLHYLYFASYTADPMMSPPRNTGLVGDDRLLALSSGGDLYLGVVSDEADEGTCELNEDGDQDDDILRWVEAVTGAMAPILPFTNSSALVALEDVGGNTDGATDLDGRFVCVVSESDDDRDHNGDMMLVDDLIAFLDPSDGNSASWTFDQFTPTVEIDSVGTSWMYERPERDTVLITFPERFVPADLNGDGDLLDSVPAFGVFDPSGSELDFTGPLVAVPPANAGLEFVNDIGFFRADEAADDFDWNDDGDITDLVLLRAPLSSLTPSFVSSLNNLNTSAIVRPDPDDTEIGVTFLADESIEGADYNDDGDTNDLVLRWVRVD